MHLDFKSNYIYSYSLISLGMQTTRIEDLLGGKTRFAVLKALAEARQPMTAYRIAMTKGLDPAATYRCLAEFVEFGVVESKIKGRKQTSYKLSKGAGNAAAEFLGYLQEKQPEPIDLEEWISPEAQAKRMARIVRSAVRFDAPPPTPRKKPAKENDVKSLLSRRTPGELSALIESSQIAFDELFEQKGGTFILKEGKLEKT
jgi:Fe2+ or Zn2+ uptake regulation protein